MKLTTSKSALLDIVSWGIFPVPARVDPQTPHLAGLRLDAADGTLTAAATDYQVTCRWSAPASIGEPGAILVPGHRFADLVRTLGDGSVDLETTHSTLTLRCNEGRYTWQLLPLEDYPSLSGMPPAVGTIDAAMLVQAVERTAFCAGAPDIAPPTLAAVHFVLDGDSVTMVATNKHRVGVATIPWEPCTAGAASANIRASHLAQMGRGLKADPGQAVTMGLAVTGSDPAVQMTAGFSDGSRQFITRCIGGDYMVWENACAIPAEPKTAEASASQLLAVLKRIAAVNPRGANVRMSFRSGALSLSGGTGDEMTGRETVSVGYDDEDISFVINGGYLADGLAAAGGAVRIFMTTRTKAITITPAKEEAGGSYRNMIVPVDPKASNNS
jgi:DNA polymerase-3 subunit beta